MPKTIYNSPSNLKSLNLLTLKKTLSPYLIFIVLLIIGKFTLSEFTISLPFLSYSISLFNPGLVFIIATLIVTLYSEIKLPEIRNTSRMAIGKSVESFLVIGAMSATVQLMNNSANTLHHLPSITQSISTLFSTQILPILAPFIGALGSFITGSATVSNIMFAPAIYSSSLSLGFNPIKMLALTTVGAGAGNMIALSDVLVAKTITDTKNTLKEIILYLLPFCLIYLLLVALFGWFF